MKTTYFKQSQTMLFKRVILLINQGLQPLRESMNELEHRLNLTRDEKLFLWVALPDISDPTLAYVDRLDNLSIRILYRKRCYGPSLIPSPTFQAKGTRQLFIQQEVIHSFFIQHILSIDLKALQQKLNDEVNFAIQQLDAIQGKTLVYTP